MSTFEDLASKGQFNQTHFTIIEIDLPVVEGECTIGGAPGFGTPLSCDQLSDGMKTYKFAEVDAPLLPGSEIYRLITNISETPTELKSGRGIASRASLNITFTDIVDADPNPFAPGVTAAVKAQGTYMAKFFARNVTKNKNIRIKNYRLESDGSIDLVNGAETRHYIIDSAKGKNSKWSISCKDELSRINLGESVWPLPLEGSLKSDLNATDLFFTVDDKTAYVAGDTVRIGDELIKVSSVSGIGTGSAVVATLGRGVPITYTNTLSLTEKDEHSATDEIFVCEISNNEKIADLLRRILEDVGVTVSNETKAKWDAELDVWLPSARINTLWIESKDTAEVLESILTYYLVDMWFDPVAQEVKISAINVWKESGAFIKENNEIDFESISKVSAESLRATRALVVYDKRFLATSDSVENYKKASLYKRTELEGADLYGEPKTKRFDFSQILDKSSADALVNRYVDRYIDPYFYQWITQERKLSFKTGDIVNIDSSQEINFDGSNSGATRAQVISIKPNYTKFGRDYTVKALSYEAIYEDGAEVILDGIYSDGIDLHGRAGRPPAAVNYTFIFDGATVGSPSTTIPAIKAGEFHHDSVITIILYNGADLQAKGGDGGDGDDITSTQETNGSAGGIVYDAMGIKTDIYLSGPTTSTNYPDANGFIRAPSGGDGGFYRKYFSPSPGSVGVFGGDGGNGGNGRSFGLGGTPGISVGNVVDEDYGINGINGVSSGGSLSDWGVDGADNDYTGGAKGKGVVDSGGVVTLHGNTSLNYVNGGGDHP